MEAVVGALYAAETAIEGVVAVASGLVYPTNPLRATLARIPSIPAPRAHHTISVVKGRAYVFGGETKPGKMADNAMTAIILPSSAVQDADYTSFPARPDTKDGPVPAARKGHTASVIGDEIFIFGGELSPQEGRGDDDEEADGTVWIFNTMTNSWRRLLPPSTSSAPPARTAAAAAASDEPGPKNVRTHVERFPQTPADPATTVPDVVAGGTFGTLFVHAGRALSDPALASPRKGKSPEGATPTSARPQSSDSPILLNDLWALDVRTGAWSALPPAPGGGRAGAALAVVGHHAYRVGGADATGAVGGAAVDWLDVSGVLNGREGEGWQPTVGTEWASVPFADPATEDAGAEKKGGEAKGSVGPPARRGASLLTVTTGQGREYLLLLGGEELDGASPRYCPEVWSLQLPSEPGASAARVKDKTRAAVGRKTGEAEWAQVQYRHVDASGDEVPALADEKGIGRRGGVAACRGSEVDGASVVVWGGVGTGGEIKDDGWLITVDR